MLAAAGAEVRHQQMSVVERRQMVIDVTHADLTQVLPTITDITALTTATLDIFC